MRCNLNKFVCNCFFLGFRNCRIENKYIITISYERISVIEWDIFFDYTWFFCLILCKVSESGSTPANVFINYVVMNGLTIFLAFVNYCISFHWTITIHFSPHLVLHILYTILISFMYFGLTFLVSQ